MRAARAHAAVAAVAVVATLGACGGRRDASPAAAADAGALTAGPLPDARPNELEVRSPDGSAQLLFSPGTLGAWRVTGPGVGAFALTLGASGGDLVLVSDAADSASLGRLRPGAAGLMLHDAEDKVVARLYTPDDTTFDVIGPDGIALVRTVVQPDGVVVARDKAGRPIATATRDGERWEIDAIDGTRLGSAVGTSDARAPLLWLTLDLPAPLRVIVAGAALAR